jgi:serine/threonine-protein kinase HipA
MVDCWACTVNAPVSVVPTDFAGWPAFLDDIIPSGKSRDWWVNFLNIRNLSPFAQNMQLLTNACMAPVGNLRIKEAAQRVTKTQAQAQPKRFSLNDVVKLQYDFLEYAYEQGAAVGGATGAVGFAPKLLLMRDQEQVHIDGDFAGYPLEASAYLTKFARNQRTAIDNDILRAEGIFYHVLTDIFSEA